MCPAALPLEHDCVAFFRCDGLVGEKRWCMLKVVSTVDPLTCHQVNQLRRVPCRSLVNCKLSVSVVRLPLISY